MQEVFSLYELLLSEGLRITWTHCVSQACCEANWTDEEGMTLEKTIKLMFVLVLYVLQMHVLGIETSLN